MLLCRLNRIFIPEPRRTARHHSFPSPQVRRSWRTSCQKEEVLKLATSHHPFKKMKTKKMQKLHHIKESSSLWVIWLIITKHKLSYYTYFVPIIWNPELLSYILYIFLWKAHTVFFTSSLYLQSLLYYRVYIVFHTCTCNTALSEGPVGVKR